MDEFCAITGVDADTAAIYMEMGGFDLDTAIQLFFSMNEGSGDGGLSGGDSASWPHDWMRLLFPSEGSASLPDAWLHQSLQTSTPHNVTPFDWSQFSIYQHKNGPCGVLAAYQGFLISYLMQNETLSPSYLPTKQDAAEGVWKLLYSVSSCSERLKTITFCSWADPNGGIGGIVNIQDGDKNALFAVIDQFLAPGGALLLLYSAILTFGVEDLMKHQDILPLLYGPNFLCSSALMNILLTGEAKESLGAYDEIGGAIIWKKPPASVGFLSGTEIELKIKIHDGYKFPTTEVYVLHGRDHFTTFFVVPSSTSPRQTPTTSTESFSFIGVHFNGLPPAGPAVSLVRIFAPKGVCPLNASTAALGMPKEYKPVVNSIDCVIQASPQDKVEFPKEWKKWKYEIALAIEDPENISEERPKELPPLPTFELKVEEINPDESWRCRLCFESRFATMCFGLNDPGTSHCQHCTRSRIDCGWTLWLPYDEIPADWQDVVDRQYGPMFTTILRTKWPQCKVEFEEGKDLPVV